SRYAVSGITSETGASPSIYPRASHALCVGLLFHCYQGFRQPEKPLANDSRAGEQAAHGAAVEEPDVAQVVLEEKCPLVRARPGDPFPDCEFVDQPPLPAPRQEMDQRREQMVLHREPAIRGLHKVTDSDPCNLPGELFLPRRAAHMLDHR